MQHKEYQQVVGYDTAFSLRVLFVRQEDTVWHTHDFTELVIILQGTGVHHTPFGRYEIRPGSVLIVPPAGRHQYIHSSADLELLNIMFQQDRIPLPLLDLYLLPGYNAMFAIKNEFFHKNLDYPHFQLAADEFQVIAPTLREMRRESESPQPGYRFCLLGYFMALAGNLARFYTVEHNPQQSQSFDVAQAISFLNRHYREAIFLEDLCRQVNMSRSTLQRHFLRATGMTPMTYLNSIRLHHACLALRNQDASIAEIAVHCGFPDGNFFSRFFRKTLGSTPSQFRSQWRRSTPV